MKKFLAILLLLFLFPAPTDAARLWSSGCELQGDSPDAMISGVEFSTITATDGPTTQISTATKCSGLSACRFVRGTAGFGFVSQQFTASTVATDLYFRAYVYIETMVGNNRPIISFWDVGTDGWEGGVVLETDGTLTWLDDDRNADGTGTAVLSSDTWYLIEIN